MAVVVDVAVDDPVPCGSLADATAATDPEIKPGSLEVAVPEALSVATSVVPAAPAANAAVVQATYATSDAITIFFNIPTSNC